jgi:hypothetical protein
MRLETAVTGRCYAKSVTASKVPCPTNFTTITASASASAVISSRTTQRRTRRAGPDEVTRQTCRRPIEKEGI